MPLVAWLVCSWVAVVVARAEAAPLPRSSGPGAMPPAPLLVIGLVIGLSEDNDRGENRGLAGATRNGTDRRGVSNEAMSSRLTMDEEAARWRRRWRRRRTG